MMLMREQRRERERDRPTDEDRTDTARCGRPERLGAEDREADVQRWDEVVVEVHRIRKRKDAGERAAYDWRRKADLGGQGHESDTGGHGRERHGADQPPQ